MADETAHHSHPETWPTIIAEPYDKCGCTPDHDEATPETAFPVAVINPLDADQRASLLDVLIDHLQHHEALDAYNAILNHLTATPEPTDA